MFVYYLDMDLNHLSELERQGIGQFVSRVRANIGDNLISMRLFGSRARGEGSENSDLDVLVLVKTLDIQIKHAIWDIANDIFLDTWINISPLVTTEADFKKLVDRERLIAKDIEKEGIPL